MMSSLTRSGMCPLHCSATIHQMNSDRGVRGCRVEPFVPHLVTFRLGATCQKDLAPSTSRSISAGECAFSRAACANDDADLAFQHHSHFPPFFLPRFRRVVGNVCIVRQDGYSCLEENGKLSCLEGRSHELTRGIAQEAFQ